jgi:hypothetical protein
VTTVSCCRGCLSSSFGGSSSKTYRAGKAISESGRDLGAAEYCIFRDSRDASIQFA